jgi:Tol biopolymer transport system component
MRSSVLAAAVVLGLAAAGPSQAAYPGRDGRIAIFAGAGCGSHAEPDATCHSLAFTTVLAVSPLGYGVVELLRCPGPNCVPGFGPAAAYSPDGRRVAVPVAGDPLTATPGQIAILRSDGSEVRRLAVPAVGPIAALRWLPDGRRVAAFAYAERPGRGGRALLMAADGTAAREMAWRPEGVRVWSSRGSVAISHSRGIYVWDRATGVRRLILANGPGFTYDPPDWSPDGRRLVLVRHDLRTHLQTIITVAADGTDRRIVVRAVSTGQTFDGVAWSPSGGRIAFTSGAGEGTDALSTVRTDGTRLRRTFHVEALTSPLQVDAFFGRQLSWQPRAG